MDNNLNFTFVYEDAFLLKKRVSSFLQENNIDKDDTFIFDLEINSFFDCLNELNMMNFLQPNRVYILRFVDGLNKKESESKAFVKYLENPNPDVKLIIEVNSKFSFKSKLGEILKEKTTIVAVKGLDGKDYLEYFNSELSLDGYKINSDTLKIIIEQSKYDLFLISQELEKLKIYKIDKKEIKLSDVKAIASISLEDKVYEFTNAVLLNDKEKSLKSFYDLIKQNNDAILLIGSLATKVYSTIHLKKLLNANKKQTDIEKIFNISSGRAFYMIKDTNKIKGIHLYGLLKKLKLLDYQIKTGFIEKKLGLELLLMQL